MLCVAMLQSDIMTDTQEWSFIRLIDFGQSTKMARRTRKKRLQRLIFEHTHMLQGICAHPDEFQRRELIETTGLGAQQIKFCFQNKRTQVKNLSEKEEIYRLKVPNVILRNENQKLKKARRTIVQFVIHHHRISSFQICKGQKVKMTG